MGKWLDSGAVNQDQEPREEQQSVEGDGGPEGSLGRATLYMWRDLG